jgi:predicted nucleic acid-binding protein
VKALDTPVLLALLEGSASVREHLRHLRGVEIAATEANLLELTYLALQGPKKTRGERLGALARLRRRVTVLPLDVRATEEISRRADLAGASVSPIVLAMYGALEAAGCEELLTEGRGQVPGKWSFRVRDILRPQPK